MRQVWRAVFLTGLMLSPALAQLTPWFNWTILPREQMDEIAGEVSGENAWKIMADLSAYSRDRGPSEYREQFFETDVILRRLQQYGFTDARVIKYPGGKTWDGETGELWEIKPERNKLASYLDHTAMLASGSTPAEVTAELVWAGDGSAASLKDLDVKGKIVVTEGNPAAVHDAVCQKGEAAGVIAVVPPRPDWDVVQMPWYSLRRGGRPGSADTAPAVEPKFAFILPFREGYYLRERLLAGEKITVRALVKASQLDYQTQDVVCGIPGTDPAAGNLVLTAHLFEGYIKQSANDNASGSAGLVEVARTLKTLVDSGRLPRPKRSLWFLWVPEFSGTIPWVAENRALLEQTLCNINLDMIGEWPPVTGSFISLYRTTYGNPHYINDVVENYLRYVGEATREKIQLRRGHRSERRITAPTGREGVFQYSVETNVGSSDHAVFNDWTVRVPGVMINAWPDPFYHSSLDLPDKADPTQFKRICAVAAASAWTIARADTELAIQIASEVYANGLKRMGHQLTRGLEEITLAVDSEWAVRSRNAKIFMETGFQNEIQTLETVKQLSGDDRLARQLAVLQSALRKAHEANLLAWQAHREALAADGVTPAAEGSTPAPEEQAASRLIPVMTALVREKGYRGVSEALGALPTEVKQQYPYDRRDLGSASELQSLIDGKRSVLAIWQNLLAQFPQPATLTAVENYLRQLAAAGLVSLRTGP